MVTSYPARTVARSGVLCFRVGIVVLLGRDALRMAPWSWQTWTRSLGRKAALSLGGWGTMTACRLAVSAAA